MDNCLDFRAFVSHDFPFSCLVLPSFGFGCSCVFCPLAFAILRSLPQKYVFVWNLTSPDSRMEIFWYIFFGRCSLCFRIWGNKRPAKNTWEIMKRKRNQCFRPLNVSSVAMLDMSGNPTVCGDDGKCREIQQVEKLFKKCGEMEIGRNVYINMPVVSGRAKGGSFGGKKPIS